MTADPANGRGFDPRFDPRFQPGYEPPADAAGPALEPEGTEREAPMESDAAPQRSPEPAAPEPAAPEPPSSEPSAPGHAAETETADSIDPAEPAAAPAPDRARPWILAAWIVAFLAILIGSALVWAGVTSARVIQPTGTVDQGVMVQVASSSTATALVEGGIVVVVALLALDGVRRAGVARRAGATSNGSVRAAAPSGILVDRSVIALAVIAVLGGAAATWSATWEPAQPGAVSYFGEPTYDDLWPVRLEYLASAVAGAATIAAVGACIGVLVVLAARLRSRWPRRRGRPV
jgi:hypothetical protein